MSIREQIRRMSEAPAPAPLDVERAVRLLERAADVLRDYAYIAVPRIRVSPDDVPELCALAERLPALVRPQANALTSIEVRAFLYALDDADLLATIPPDMRRVILAAWRRLNLWRLAAEGDPAAAAMLEHEFPMYERAASRSEESEPTDAALLAWLMEHTAAAGTQISVRWLDTDGIEHETHGSTTRKAIRTAMRERSEESEPGERP